jgi:hypothetical protein
MKTSMNLDFFWLPENKTSWMFVARESLFVSGGRNAERGMIALRVQDPAARHEEAYTILTPGDVSRP